MDCCVWQAPSRSKSCSVRGATIRSEEPPARHFPRPGCEHAASLAGAAQQPERAHQRCPTRLCSVVRCLRYLYTHVVRL